MCGVRSAKRPSVPALVVDGGEDVGVRPGVADRREHALGAAQVEQEVVDERDARAISGASLVSRRQRTRSATRAGVVG